jgi:dUTP pyrophosphatase
MSPEQITIQGREVNFVPFTNKTVILVKKLTPDAILPVRSTPGSAAFDLHVNRYDSPAGTVLTYGSGLAFQFPENTYGLLLARSSCYKKKHQLVNGIGLIDQDYRGEVMANYLLGDVDFYQKGDRFGQLLIQGPNVNPFEIEFRLVDELNETTRGQGGFGSTGL